MSVLISAFSLLAVAVAILLGLGFYNDPLSSLLLQNDVIYCYDHITTLSNRGPKEAKCLSVRAGKFHQILTDTPNQTRSKSVIRSNGTVIPGLWDSHGHILGYGELLSSVNLFESDSLNEIRARIRKYLETHPHEGSESMWIEGKGWDHAAFGRMPTAADLDADPRLRGKYILLSRIDYHCIWASSAILSLLPSPLPSTVPGGQIVQDPGPGVFCDNAMDLVYAHWPRPSSARMAAQIRLAVKELSKVGLVGVHDAAVAPDALGVYEELVREPGWPLRVYAMLECGVRNSFCPDEVRRVERGDGMLIARSVKLFADGALGSWGSALMAPYHDRPTTNGTLLLNRTALIHLTHSWAHAGYQVNIHAIGDHAARLALDAFNTTLLSLCHQHTPPATCQHQQHRFRLEHAQILHPHDQARLAALRIIPSIQPTHATSDMAMAAARLGAARLRTRAYRLRSLRALRPPLGSDFPVEPPDPFDGMYAAVERRSPRTGRGVGGADEGFLPDEAIGVDEALRGWTVNAAWAAGLEDRAGRVERGFWADWVVVEMEDGKGWGEVRGDELRGMGKRVRETWVGGRKVYDRNEEGQLEA